MAEVSGSLKRYDVAARLSEIAVCNGIVYLAGQVPENDPGADLAGQTQEVLDHVERLLVRAGSGKQHILQCQIFLSDIREIATMNEVWDAWVVPGHTPPRATVQAKLADPRWRIEVLVVAAVCPD